jgi:hypothetical protein
VEFNKIRGMENRDDYKLIFYSVHEILDGSHYDGVNSFAPDKITCSEYSLTRPAFKFTTDKEKIFLIYVIEINQIITKEIIKSWINYSQECSFLRIIVPEEIKTNVESILAREISHYEVLPFRFRKKGRSNRIVEIDM